MPRAAALRAPKVDNDPHTPPLFYRPPLEQQSYVGNFTRLQATSLLFSNAIPRDLRARAAVRMRQYPSTLADDPLFERASAWLADGGLVARAAYAAAWPLGRLQDVVLGMQDHWAVVRYVRAHPRMGRGLTRAPAALDWTLLEAEARRESDAATRDNPFGFDPSYWDAHAAQLMSESEAATAGGLVPVIKTVVLGLRNARESDEWRDLELLLETTRALGATPLVVATPFHGPFYDHWGVTREQRAAYYRQLRERCRKAGVPVVDFEAHDGDRGFVRDPESHLGAAGWVAAARVLDDFYHGRLSALRDGPR